MRKLVRSLMLATALAITPTAAAVVSTAVPAAADEHQVWHCWDEEVYTHTVWENHGGGHWTATDWYDVYWNCWDGYNHTWGYSYS